LAEDRDKIVVFSGGSPYALANHRSAAPIAAKTGGSSQIPSALGECPPKREDHLCLPPPLLGLGFGAGGGAEGLGRGAGAGVGAA
jgi:hypothetical protein